MLPGAVFPSLQAGYILAGLLTCTPSAPPEVVIEFKNAPPRLETGESTRDLARTKENSTSPNYGAEFPIVGGLTESNYNVSYKTQFLNMSSSVYSGADSAAGMRQVCVHPKTVTVTVTYMPVIYVASDYPHGSCRYNLTEEHEMRHVSVDTITINGFLPKIRQAVVDAVSGWHGVGPVDETQMEAVQNSLSDQLKAPVKKIFDQLQQTRRARQQAVDSRDEYRRLSTSCRNERF